jgi:tartrate dehydrogenase/decarboxylase/D-malate dehydrogenase
MRLMKAIEIVCAAGTVTPDVGRNATTRMVTDAVIEAFRDYND